MDYHIKKEDYEAVIEAKKNKIKNQVLESYISLRKKKGITQQEVADRTGMRRTNIVRIETGKSVPTIEVLVKLAEALDMNLEVRMVERELSDE